MDSLRDTTELRDLLCRHGVINFPLMPVLPRHADDGDRSPIWLKLENLQPFVRSYKLRGALASVLLRCQAMGETALRQRGLLTASVGNFGQALAHVCAQRNLPLCVLVPEQAAAMKLQRLREIYTNVVLRSVSAATWWQCLIDGAANPQEATAGFSRAIFVSPATDSYVLAGNGTLGAELGEQLPHNGHSQLDVLVPYGGGGLVRGISHALRPWAAVHRPNLKLRIFACEVSSGAPLHAALAQGSPVEVHHHPGFIDGIGSRSVLPQVFADVCGCVEGSLVVTPRQVKDACGHLLHRHGLVVEGAGAVSLAAAWRYARASATTICIVSGGNVSLPTLLAAIADV